MNMFVFIDLHYIYFIKKKIICLFIHIPWKFSPSIESFFAYVDFIQLLAMRRIHIFC